MKKNRKYGNFVILEGIITNAEYFKPNVQKTEKIIDR